MSIDKVTCLCFDKRKELWPRLSEQVKRTVGKDLELFIAGDGQDADLKYDHIDTNELRGPFLYNLNKGHYNAFLCHKKMAQRAIEEDVKNVLFLEDDAHIVEDRAILLRMPQVTTFIDSDSWDVIYLGWWQKLTQDGSEDRDDLEKRWRENKEWGLSYIDRPPAVAHEICALHGLLINRSFLPIIANAPAGPIDSFLLHNFDNMKIRAMFMWPKIVHVSSGWSYCENSFAKRSDI